MKEVCVKKSCKIGKCSLRPPRECQFFREYNRCKFGSYYSYRHVRYDKIEDSETVLNMIEDTTKKVNTSELALRAWSKMERI